MSMNNNDARTLSGVSALDLNGLDLPSTRDAIRIGGNPGTLRQVIGKDAITDKVKWLDITETQIGDREIVPRMIDDRLNFTFTDVNCRNITTASVLITTSLTLPDLTATNEMVVSNSGVQVWSVNKNGRMDFIKDASSVPTTYHTRIEQGLITTEETLTTTKSLWGTTALSRKVEIDSATGNIYQYETFSPRNEYFSVVNGAGFFRSLSVGGGIVNTGAFTTTGLSTFVGIISQIGNLVNEGNVIFTKLTIGTDYTLDVSQGQSNFGGNIKTTNITTGITAETGTINCFDLVASNKITTKDITITGLFDFSGSLDLNTIEAHTLKVKTKEADPTKDIDVFVVEGENKTYRQVKLYTGLELYDRSDPSGVDLRIQMDMLSGNIITTGGFTGNLFAFSSGTITGELFCQKINARNGLNTRWFLDPTETANTGTSELIGSYYGMNLFITENGRIMNTDVSPPVPSISRISLLNTGNIECINLTASGKVKADTIETDNLIFDGNIDLGNIEAHSLVIQTPADEEKIRLSSTTGTITGEASLVGNNHKLDRLDITETLNMTNLNITTSTGGISQTGTGGIVQSTNTTILNVLQALRVSSLASLSTIISGGSITAGTTMSCAGITSSLGGAINGAQFQINQGVIIENPPPTTTPPTPEGYALIMNGKSQFNSRVDFLSSPVNIGASNNLITTDVVNIYGHDLDLFGSVMKLYKSVQGTPAVVVPSEIRTFDNTSGVPLATGTIISCDGYVESKDIRPTGSIQYEHTIANGQNKLFGASATNRVFCKNLDLSDDSNVLPVNPTSLEFGVYYQPNPAVELTSDNDNWQYWADNLFVRKPVYTDPTLTTIEIFMTYNIRNDAFGDFLIGIASSTDEGTTKTPVAQSPQICPLQSAPGIGSMRHQFVMTYQVVLENQTYNQEILYYPIFRTNTDDDGLITVKHGGDPNRDDINPACVIRGRPYPSFFRIFRSGDFSGGLI